MKLVIFGDSHSYGTELIPERLRGGNKPHYLNNIASEYYPEIEEYRVNNAWPYLLRKMLGESAWEVINLSQAGSGNHRISMRLINWLHSIKDDLNPSEIMISIGWSNPERYDVWSEDRQSWSAFYPGDPLLSKESEFYFKHIQSYKESYQRYYGQIVMAQTILNNFGIRYIMFNSISSPLGGEKLRVSFDHLIDSRKIFYRSLFGFCSDAGCERAPGNHFFNSGHQLWAETMHGFMHRLYPDFIQNRESGGLGY